MPCEDCDVLFVGLPTSVDEAGRIAPANVRGEPLQLHGRILDASGFPVAGVAERVSHDSTGIYPPDGALAETRVRDARGIWQVERDLQLGLNIPNYAECAAR